jgi:hypothetical protein
VDYLARIRKFLVAAAAVAAQLVAVGVLSGDAERWVQVGLGALSALLVWWVANAPAPEAAGGYTGVHRDVPPAPVPPGPVPPGPVSP